MSRGAVRCRPVVNLVIVALAGALGAAAQEHAHKDGEAGLHWRHGPATGDMDGLASITVPKGYQFVGAADTRTLMEAMHNPTSGDERGLIAPEDEEDGDWFAVFEYDDTGYVKDDERDKLDADAILKSIRKGTEAGNEERRKRGWSTLDVVGWETPPYYDPQTNSLCWATRARSEGHEIINFNTRRLGRAGYMRVTLVCDPGKLSTTRPKFDGLMSGFSFATGKRYADWRPGDKVAAYGLTALITGGAAAVAVKTGLFKYIWKAGVLVIAGIGAFFKKIFGRKNQ